MSTAASPGRPRTHPFRHCRSTPISVETIESPSRPALRTPAEAVDAHLAERCPRGDSAHDQLSTGALRRHRCRQSLIPGNIGRVAAGPSQWAHSIDPDRIGRVRRCQANGIGRTLPNAVTGGFTGEGPVWSDLNNSNEQAILNAALLSGHATMRLPLRCVRAGDRCWAATAARRFGTTAGFAGLHLANPCTQRTAGPARSIDGG